MFHVKHDSPTQTPPAPELARGVFSDALPVAERFAALLATEATLRGLIGPREVPRLWERHLVNCALVTDLVPESASVCDIGSGAGLPGIVMAIRRPDLSVTLVEPLLRRTTFLDEAVARLGLGNVEVVRARAEAVHGTRTFDVVTSRAVAPMVRLSEWSLPLVRTGGLFLAMKGSSVQAELDAAMSAIRSGGARLDEVVVLGDDLIEPPVRVVRVVKE
ncbi:16S rRNA (guanine(527)-N(7))-methyltransferase RsmG [Nocardioides pocheonensis]|uniref:Ribosomal RNA small subunit methyltransferase G n=1 Tax=Nocardioides pocheonensis TaxID=661485 RepID=A0A3N0GJE1_9ACTN|nr:16S rRNA (guanine(527)-N(7))-methyltransferase RsmG [Nocardioides pocheonensis]